MTQMNLGIALETLGARESGTAHLEEAVAAYRAALEERTRDQVPLDWAMTQMNLGIALETLGQRESGTAHLEEAVAAWNACLAVTNSVWPSDWVRIVETRREDCRGPRSDGGWGSGLAVHGVRRAHAGSRRSDLRGEVVRATVELEAPWRPSWRVRRPACGSTPLRDQQAHVSWHAVRYTWTILLGGRSTRDRTGGTVVAVSG